MIDILPDTNRKNDSGNARCVLLFAFLCFVVWDSGYVSVLLDRYSSDKQEAAVSRAMIIKSEEMSDDQLYTCSSPVLDELADRSGVSFRVLSCKPGSLSAAPEWIRSLFSQYSDEAPCLALEYRDGHRKRFDAPSTISEFRERIGAK